MHPVSDQTKSGSSIYSAEQKDPRSTGTRLRERNNLFILTNIYYIFPDYSAHRPKAQSM